MIKVWVLIFNVWPSGYIGNSTITIPQMISPEECDRVGKLLSVPYKLASPTYKCVEYTIKVTP